MNNSTFKVGDRVLCINGVPGIGTLMGRYIFPNGYIKVNRVYEVEAVRSVRHALAAHAGAPIETFEKLILKGTPVLAKTFWDDIKPGDDIGFGAARFHLV